MGNIRIIEGDITKAEVDVIVNAANSIMLGGGGVDGAIHMAAGSKLLEECRKVKSVNGIRCPTGEARITLSGNLKSKYVIHTVGPRYRYDQNSEGKLQAAYRNSLNLAISNRCQTIAFPAISCGAYGYPVNDAAHSSLKVCLDVEYQSMEIFIYVYGRSMFEIWTNALRNISR